jgi:hypothetical protein
VSAGEPDFDDRALLDFAAQGRMLPRRPGDALFGLSDGEVTDSIVAIDDGYALETSERGGPSRRVMESPSLEVVRRALIERVGSAVRHRRRLPRVNLPVDVATLPEGFAIDESPQAVRLTWSEHGDPREAAFPAGATGVREAVRFAHLPRLPEQELLAAYAHPQAGGVLPL